MLKSIHKQNRIFVNRSLNLGYIKMIGFDMDHTLAPYRRETFEALAFRETLKKLINSGYPEELSNLTFKPHFLIRGLLVDRERGNILKVDGHKYVKDAYHGHLRLDKAERHKLYNSQSFKAQDFVSIDTFFALSEVQLFVEIVDFMSKFPGRIQKSYKEVYQDVVYFIDMSHADGSIKEEVVRYPEKYLEKDPHLSKALVRLIDAGKKLFLLTNSLASYTEDIMNYVLSHEHPDFPHWKNYWDVAIVGASKPSFFVGNQPFLEVVENKNLFALHSDAPFKNDRIYHGGNARLLEKIVGYKGDEILYVGDHIFGDIIRSKASLNWRTMLIMEEIEREIQGLKKVAVLDGSISQELEKREILDESLHNLRSQIASNTRQGRLGKNFERLEKENQKLTDELERQKLELPLVEGRIKAILEERDKSFHPIWGELMKAGLERSRFANQVNLHACLYTSRASNLRFYSPYKKFLSYYANMPHDEA